MSVMLFRPQCFIAKSIIIYTWSVPEGSLYSLCHYYFFLSNNHNSVHTYIDKYMGEYWFKWVACIPSTLSHYLIQYKLFISEAMWHISEGTYLFLILINKIYFMNTYVKLEPLLQGQWLRWLSNDKMLWFVIPLPQLFCNEWQHVKCHAFVLSTSIK